jgi:peptide/nickel transport system substrate-binding protein
MSEYVQSQRIIFKRNPYFWKKDGQGNQLPYIGTFEYIITPDTNAEVLSFRGGTSDALDIPIQQYPSVDRYAKRDNYTVIDKGADWGFTYFCLNQCPTSTMSKTPVLLKLFSDVRFRQACSYAINRQTICDEVSLGLGHPLWGPETPADVNYFDPKVRQYPYNPQVAKQLLEQMGCTPGPNGKLMYEGQPVKFNILTNVENAARRASATIISNNLQDVGIDATFTPLAFNDLIRRLNANPYDWQACVLGFTGGPEPNDGSVIWRSVGPYHQWWPKEPHPETAWEAKIDADFARGAHNPDPKQRKIYYDDFQEILGQEQPMIFLTYGEDYSAVRNHFGNIEPTAFNGLGGSVFWNLEEIYDTHAVRPTP